MPESEPSRCVLVFVRDRNSRILCSSWPPPGSRDIVPEGEDMQISARNQLRGTIKSVAIESAGLMAEVIVDVGGQEVVATITACSARRLRLAAGDAVVAVIKAT